MDRMRILWLTCLGVGLAVWQPSVGAQPFQNLDFEEATVEPTPAGSYGGEVDPAAAFPGWTVGVALSNQYTVFVLYNNLTLGSRAEVLIGPNFPNALNASPLQGSYSAILQFGPGTTTGAPFLSQTGLVPGNAKSISFLVSQTPGDLQLSLNNTVIPLVSIGGGRMAGDVSAFASQTAQLMFTTTLNEGGVSFDDVQFSPVVVPEPSVFCLVAIGTLLIRAFKLRPYQRVSLCRVRRS